MRYVSLGLALTIATSLAANSFAAEIVNLDANNPSTLSLGPGNVVNSWTNQGTVGGTFIPNPGAQPTLVAGPNSTNVINFTGSQVLKDISTGAGSTTDLTAFIVTSVATNTGGYNAFLTSNQTGNNDYSSGFNIDQGSGSNNVNWSVTNVESTQGGGGGGQNLMTSAVNFNTYHLVEVHYSSASGQLYIDGTAEGSRGSNGAAIILDEIRVGSRNYNGSESGFFHGNIGAVQIYTGSLTNAQVLQIGSALSAEFGITTFTPEPSSLLLAGLGLVGLVFVGRKAKVAKLVGRATPAIGLVLTVAISFATESFAAEILNLNSNIGVTTSGGNVTGWTNTGTVGGTFTQTNGNTAPTLIAGPNGTQVINFSGANSLSDLTFGQTSVPEATVFIVAAVTSNNGGYNSFAAGVSGPGSNDYQTGFNTDQGAGSSSSFSEFNLEGAKGNGEQNLLTASSAFGTYHVLELHIWNGGAANQQLVVDGVTEGSRTGGSSNSALNLQDLYIGSRHYGGNDTGFFHGNIGAVQIYDGELTPAQLNQIGFVLAGQFGITTSYTPEPSSLMLAALALVGLVFVGRKANATSR